MTTYVKSKRSIYLDTVRSVAVFLVVAGHCIQYGMGNVFYEREEYFNNFFFRLIYSFHMPLFMVMSGYLFCATVNRSSAKEVIKGKVKRLLLPIVSWNGISLAAKMLLHKKVSVDSVIKSFFVDLWFLWAVFFCCITVLLVKEKFQDKWQTYVVIMFLLVLLPENDVIALYIFMYPYFVAGYFWKKKKVSHWFDKKVGKEKKIALLWILVVIFSVLFTGYNKDCFIYTTGICVWKNERQFLIDTYRYTIGFVGCALVLLLIREILDTLKGTNTLLRAFSAFGQKSMGIYIVTVYGNSMLLLPLMRNAKPAVWLVCLETIGMLMLGFWGTKFLENIPTLNTFLLGQRTQKRTGSNE